MIERDSLATGNKGREVWVSHSGNRPIRLPALFGIYSGISGEVQWLLLLAKNSTWCMDDFKVASRPGPFKQCSARSAWLLKSTLASDGQFALLVLPFHFYLLFVHTYNAICLSKILVDHCVYILLPKQLTGIATLIRILKCSMILQDISLALHGFQFVLVP